MPTRFIDPNVLRQAFDVLAPPGAAPKEFLRWKQLSRQVGLGEHWIRKRYHGLVQSELNAQSVDLICKALERRFREAKDSRISELMRQLSSYDPRHVLRRTVSGQAPSDEPQKMRVVNVGFIRASSASYAMRTEAGIRAGLVNELRTSHLVDDETLDISGAATSSAESKAIYGLLDRFNSDPRYVDRTYLVTLGTPATLALVKLLSRDARFRSRLGKDFRIIFAAVTNAERTGILRFDRDYVGGMAYGNLMTERVRFIREAFPERPVAYLYDPTLLPDQIILEELQEHPELEVLPAKINSRRGTHVPREMKGRLVIGWYYVNLHIHELVRDNPEVPFAGINTTDLSRGAVLSTGNDDFLTGVECAGRLIGPDCRNEINLGDIEVLTPQAVYGLNQKACNIHGLIPKVAARSKCKVVLD
jgi:hypothetical protein